MYQSAKMVHGKSVGGVWVWVVTLNVLPVICPNIKTVFIVMVTILVQPLLPLHSEVATGTTDHTHQAQRQKKHQIHPANNFELLACFIIINP